MHINIIFCMSTSLNMQVIITAIIQLVICLDVHVEKKGKAIDAHVTLMICVNIQKHFLNH